MSDFYGLKARDSILLESIHYDALLTNRAEPLKRAGKIVGHQIWIDPAGRWKLEVRC